MTLIFEKFWPHCNTLLIFFYSSIGLESPRLFTPASSSHQQQQSQQPIVKSLPDLNTRNPRTHTLTSALAKHAQALKDHEARVQAQLALMGSSKQGNSVKSQHQPRSFAFESHSIQPVVQSKHQPPVTNHYDFQSQQQQPITTHHQPITKNHHDDYGFSVQKHDIFHPRNKIVNPHQPTPSYPVQEHKDHHVSPVHYEGMEYQYHEKLIIKRLKNPSNEMKQIYGLFFKNRNSKKNRTGPRYS